MEELQFLAIGEAMAEIRRDGELGFSVGFAGDTFNTAVYCARALGPQGQVGFCSRVGEDPLSDEFVALAQREMLETSHIVRDPDRQIGIYSVATDDLGERSFAYWRESSAARQLFNDKSENVSLPQARIIYLSGITLAIMSVDARRRLMGHLMVLSQSGEAYIAFDSNYRPKLWEDKPTAQQVIGDMWQIADIAFPSIDDEIDLFDDASEQAFVDRFSKLKFRACAIKRGSRGPLSLTLDADAVPDYRSAEKVVDTTAAGDSFNGGYLGAMLSGADEAACLKAGHNMASHVVGFSGAIVPK